MARRSPASYKGMHEHSLADSIAIGQGSAIGAALPSYQSKPTLSTQKSLEQEQRFEDISQQGGASPYFQPY